MGVYPTLLDITTWEPGQHLSIIGDTGSGKTTVAQRILALREYVIVLRSKPDDVRWIGYKKVRHGAAKWIEDVKWTRFLVEPEYGASQRREFSEVLDRIYAKHGGWTIFLDDLPVMQKLGPPLHARNASLIDQALTMGRSKDISIVTAMQLPVDATSYAIGESRITISFMLSPSHLKVLREKTSDLMAQTVLTLGEHDLAIFDRRSHAVWRGRLDLATDAFAGDFVPEKVRTSA